MDGRIHWSEGDVDPLEVLMNRSLLMSESLLTLSLVALGMCTWAAAPVTRFDLSPATLGSDGAPEWDLSPEGPGWLHIPEMTSATVSLRP